MLCRDLGPETAAGGARNLCRAGSGGDRFVRQCRRFSFALEAVERGRPALRLRCRRPGADRSFQAFARLRRLPGAAADPGGRGGAVGRRGACRGGRTRYRRKFDIAEAALAGRFGFYRPQGGFFLWLDVGDGEAAALRLSREAGIRVPPGGYTARASAGRDNPGARYIRIAVVHDEAVLDTAFARIARVL